MLMCIKIALFPIINQNLQKPMIHWLLRSIGDSHVVFVTLSSRTNALPENRPGRHYQQRKVFNYCDKNGHREVEFLCNQT